MKKMIDTWRMITLALLCFVGWTTNGLAQDESDRKITSTDTLIIDVFGEKGLSVERRVEQGGTINYPLLGNVEVAGKTTPEVAAFLTRKLKAEFMVNPQVSVNVKEFGARTVTVLGEVAGRLGAVKLPGERQMDILEAIAEAGNFTANAKKSQIELWRKGKLQKFKLEVLLKSTDPKKKIWLEPGDVIIVPERMF